MLLDDLLITITNNNVNHILQRSQSPSLSLKVIAGARRYSSQKMKGLATTHPAD